MNPYLVLGVPVEADDQVIRQAYLQAIKESPPDSDPKRFQAVSQAYQKIKDQPSRHQHYLFNQDCPADSPLDALARHAGQRRDFEPLDFAAMKEYLTAMGRADAR